MVLNMEDNIEPTTILGKGEKYRLIDQDFLLITALRELTTAINKLREK